MLLEHVADEQKLASKRETSGGGPIVPRRLANSGKVFECFRGGPEIVDFGPLPGTTRPRGSPKGGPRSSRKPPLGKKWF